ncbi:PAS domain S-box protein [Chloroflexota bacterium]
MTTDKGGTLRRKKFLEETRELTDSLQQSNKLLADASKRLSKEIAERKQAEELMRILAENSPVGIYIVQNNVLAFVNTQFQKYTGYSQNELLEMDPMSIVHPEDREKVRKYAVEMLKGNTDASYEFRVNNKNGETRWAMETATSITYKGERATLGNFMDITERKQIEEALQENEAFTSSILENAPHQINVINPDMSIRYVNPAFEKVNGWTLEEVIGKKPPYPWSLKETEDDKSSRIRRTMVNESGKTELLTKKKNGDLYWIEIESKPVIQDGKLKFILVNAVDITERKEAEQKIEELYGQEKELRQNLEEEMEWRVDFTRALVHELKTPLTPILAAGELLQDEVHDATLQKLIDNIRRSASTMSTRIDTLLDLARGEMDMLELDYSKVDTMKLLNQVYDEMTPMAAKQKLSIVADLPTSLPQVWADEGRIEQVMTNLITNAFKWSPDEGEVIFRASETDDSLRIEVQDSGPGIANENKDKIFEAYYRVQSNTPRIGGLGLGLALCKTIIDCHNGTIGVESKEGKGSTFFFTIPMKADDK